MHAIVTYHFFDSFIMIIIVASSIALAAEDPVDEKSAKNEYLAYFDYVFTCIFAVEMVLKVSFSSFILSMNLLSHQIIMFCNKENLQLAKLTIP